jgi:hypothetical protein
MKSSLLLCGALLLAAPALTAQTNLPAAREEFMVLPLAKARTPEIATQRSNYYGIPFVKGNLPFNSHGTARVEVGRSARRIFLLGMTDSPKTSAWSDPTNYAVRYFIGDELGQIQLEYADGARQVFPLILGQSLWWGPPFNLFPRQVPSSQARLRKAFAAALRLYPPAPVEDGDYMAVINPRAVPLKSITVQNSPEKKGTVVIAGITVELAGTNETTGITALAPDDFSGDFAKFVEKKPLCSLGEEQKQTRQELKNLELALYDNNESFKGKVAPQTPQGYAGPGVSFKGSLAAEVLANAFSYNVQDMLNKIDGDGMYHTSTQGAEWWKDDGMGSTNTGKYYVQCWSRDVGRTLQELSELDYTNDALRCADYCLRMAHLWEENPSLKVHGVFLPPHWCRMINKPDSHIAFENDGHGLISLSLYKLWEHLPNRDEWLRARWLDIKAAGDWIPWQFAHPEISGATRGALHTTGESASGSGYSVYPDSVCMDALRALARMADSIGETNSAAQWRQCADEMQAAMGSHYIIHDPKYGLVWTLEHAGWPYQSSVLGPLVFLADYEGFAPEDEDDGWRSANEAAYRRLVDTYRPFGFYGLTMGYGQGFMAQSALLLDQMHDTTRILDWAAKEIYDPRFGSFIVSEGVQMDPTGQFWFRFGDLGNGVQEAEIIKALRLVIAVDDTRPDRLQFYPRMPYGWKEMRVDKYPLLFEKAGNNETALLDYQLQRSGDRMELEISADRDLGAVPMRLGPFEKQPQAADIRVNGQTPAGARVEHSGDSWWIQFTAPVSPTN